MDYVSINDLCEDIIVIIFEYLNITNINKQIYDITKNDIINLKKKKINLKLVNKYWKSIIENYFTYKIYFPINVDINIVMKYNCRQIIAKYDTKLNDSDLKYISNLTYLDLYWNTNIKDKGLEYLPNLTYLYLQHNTNITDKGLEYLPNLTYLKLWKNTNITDKGLEYLPNLTSLQLYRNTNITDKGLEHLPECYVRTRNITKN